MSYTQPTNHPQTQTNTMHTCKNTHGYTHVRSLRLLGSMAFIVIRGPMVCENAASYLEGIWKSQHANVHVLERLVRDVLKFA